MENFSPFAMAIKERNRSFRHVRVKLADRVVTHFRKRNPRAARCAVHGTVLPGVPRGRAVDLRKIPKTKKRPQRPYGGVLGSRAMREEMERRARSLSGEKE